ncbi:MAG: SET domain-containing protein-lysine N-methyltransferase [Candidatus Buchananbacteria bacterium]|nr:SET domain-containing protein-lysine N-methyltransferase [Candidatus Buchananbacteria bacterium]
MTNPNITISTNKFGKCLIANKDIAKDEIIAEFDGEVYEAEKCTDLPKDIADHAIQFAEHTWKDSSGIARYINHSCEPNCGIKGLFTLVAMNDIKEGEELLWDYDMTEDSDWRMECLCGTPSCRKIIGSFSLVPNTVRQKYKGYISDWLIEKYKLQK